MFTKEPTNKSKYVLLRSLKSYSCYGNKPIGFFTTYNKEDPESSTMCNGEVTYEIIGYAETIPEAQTSLRN
jgi:hypothetical protein